MKNKWLNLMLFILCLWPIAIHLALPQAKPIPPNTYLNEVNAATQADILLDIKMNRMCHVAADFGFDAAKEGTTREQMHQELKEALNEGRHNR